MKCQALPKGESGSVVSLQRSEEVHGGKACPPPRVEKGEGCHVTDGAVSVGHVTA